MTNHIEQLMKAAGVKQYKRSYFECKGGRSTICLCPQIGAQNAWCKEECDGEEMQEKVEYFCPAFTPAKQLELIKLLSDFRCFQELDNSWVMTHCYLQGVRFYRIKGSKDFSDTLAYLILYLIVENQLNKSEVKKILED